MRNYENYIFSSPVFPFMPSKVQGNLKALIIDDETDIRFLLSSILRQKKIQSSFAGSLSEADKILSEGTAPHFIFLDNYLPDGLGLNYIHKLKMKYPSSKVVMMTAHDNVSDRQKAKHEGVDFFIGKPFSRELIYKAIEEAGG